MQIHGHKPRPRPSHLIQNPNVATRASAIHQWLGPNDHTIRHARSNTAVVRVNACARARGGGVGRDQWGARTHVGHSLVAPRDRAAYNAPSHSSKTEMRAPTTVQLAVLNAPARWWGSAAFPSDGIASSIRLFRVNSENTSLVL